ncbi:MAG: glycosyltransferase family 1 protein [bacterium]|nr:glycosyltransferase family 1 protein [bacterium]
MRVLMTTQPGLGHFHPMVPIARALRDAGHEVAFACAESFRPRVAAHGFASFSAGLDWLESEIEHRFPDLVTTWLEAENHLRIVRDVFAEVAAQRMVPDLSALVRDWRPQLIVRNDFEFAGAVVAEKLDIPHAAVGIEFLMPAQFWRPLVGPQLAQLRAANGLPAQPSVGMLYRYLHLSFIPPSYQFADARSVPVAHFLRPAWGDCEPQATLPEWLAELPERPTVYVTLGTVFNRTTAVFEAIVEGLAGEPVNVIVTTGHGRDPADLGPLPSNVRAECYIPQSLLFPRCDLVVAHGGVNTIMAALRHGLPLLLTPLSAHHPFHASRVSTLGLGAVLRRRGRLGHLGQESWRELSPASVRATVRELLETPSYRERARGVAAEMERLPGPERAVALLEKLEQDKAPQLAADR